VRIRFAIDFRHPFLVESELPFHLTPRAHAREIAPARSFCRLEEVESLRQVGLARGGTLEYALVVDRDGLLNGPLRFRDEFVRHKILDLLGDLALLGAPLEGRIRVIRGGHALHGRLVAELLRRRDAWSLVPAAGDAGVYTQPSVVAVPA
jgi:UDP-3-O-[3-hydroxymyristoyl] N-acetylglucosamine deacetylase